MLELNHHGYRKQDIYSAVYKTITYVGQQGEHIASLIIEHSYLAFNSKVIWNENDIVSSTLHQTPSSFQGELRGSTTLWV